MKTKAKQRYLKRKKERRKQRSKGSGEVQDGEVAVDDVEDDVDAVDDDDRVGSPENSNPTTPLPSKPKRPKKRRRVEDEHDDDDAMAVDTENLSPRTSPERPRTPDTLPALPSFPLPALPNAPSKSELALLGLDRALVGAELIPPSTILPIPLAKEDGGTRLSERTRRRLRDIGVTELFAGKTLISCVWVLLLSIAQCKRPYCHSCCPRSRMNYINLLILLETFAFRPQQEVARHWHMSCLSSK